MKILIKSERWKELFRMSRIGEQQNTGRLGLDMVSEQMFLFELIQKVNIIFRFYLLVKNLLWLLNIDFGKRSWSV